MSNIINQYFITSVNLKLIDFNVDDFKCALFTGDYNEGILKDTQYYNQISAYEYSGNVNYQNGGISLSAHSVSSDYVNNMTIFNANDIVFNTSAGNIENIRYAGIYHVSTGIIVCVFDFTRNRNIIENTNLTIKFSNNILFKSYQKV